MQGYKTPEYDENGYCVHRPVFNSDTKILDFRLYSLVSSSYFQIASRLYSRYVDEPTIFFREYDRKIILCLPKDGSTIAIKGGGLEGFALKPEYKSEFALEYIYLMMRHEKFSKQFPQGMNAISILNGWIPRLDGLEQKDWIKSYRENCRKELTEGLEILAS